MNRRRTYSHLCRVPAPRLRDAGVSVRQVPLRYARSAEIVLCWAEENRLLLVADNSHLSLYLYDAGGERAYKLTGDYHLQNTNGQWFENYTLTTPTLYASPYLVANRQGYTKHYYAGSERIVSKIGGGGLRGTDVLANVSSVNTLWDEVVAQTSLGGRIRPQNPQMNLMQGLYDWQDSVQPENDCYWYHPDHLGSSSWITYTDGSAVQHLHYLPWGEDFVDQRSTTWNAMYTFSAKEKDAETGLSYFGSRYYSSDLSIWLSVDPMAMKFPHQSNYVYCSNNPLKVIDPNGEDEWEVNQSGYIRHIKNNKPDRLYAVYGYGKERWGKRKSDVDPLDVDKSIMNTIDNRGKYTTFSTQNNRAKMDELFNFFADNTEVEWTQLSIHDEFENQYDYLSTSHENINSDLPLRYEIMVYAKAEEGTLDAFKHSHPNNYTGFIIYYQIIYPYTCHIPSGDDRKTKNEILDEYRLDKPKPQFFLRNGGHNYVY